MKNPIHLLLLGTALFSSTLTGCKKDDEPVGIDVGSAGNNAYVINEGGYGKGNAAVSLYNKASKALNADIFKAVNQANLGDVLQSMAVVGNRGYLVVNNSNRIEVVGLPDFRSVATIGGITQPRYLLPVGGGKGYLTEWRGSYPNYQPGRLTQLNLTTNTVGSSVTVGILPGQPVALNGSIYVPNQGSSPATPDSTVSVVSEATGLLTATISVSRGPNGLVADKNGKIWVLCDGDYLSRASALVSFNPATPTVQTRLPFALSGGAASGLRISPDGQQLYYSYNGAEYRMGITDTALPTVPFIRRSFYGFNIDPRTNIIYATNAADYVLPGSVLRYQPNGTLIDTVVVKTSPNGVVFY